MLLIDADEAYKILTDYYHQRTEIQHKALKEAFERVPTVDAVPVEWVKKWFTRHIDEMFEDYEEVVHCKNCRFYLQSHEKCELIDTRLRFYETDKTWTEDCFCSWGERRDEDGD